MKDGFTPVPRRAIARLISQSPQPPTFNQTMNTYQALLGPEEQHNSTEKEKDSSPNG